MSLLNKRILPRLEGEYVAKVASYKEIENEQGGYVEVTLILPDRDYKYCIFPTQVDYVASCLRNQFEILEEVTLEQMLDLATENEFKVWFSYNQDFGRMNVALHHYEQTQEEAPDL